MTFWADLFTRVIVKGFGKYIASKSHSYGRLCFASLHTQDFRDMLTTTVDLWGAQGPTGTECCWELSFPQLWEPCQPDVLWQQALLKPQAAECRNLLGASVSSHQSFLWARFSDERSCRRWNSFSVFNLGWQRVWMGRQLDRPYLGGFGECTSCSLSSVSLRRLGILSYIGNLGCNFGPHSPTLTPVPASWTWASIVIGHSYIWEIFHAQRLWK